VTFGRHGMRRVAAACGVALAFAVPAAAAKRPPKPAPPPHAAAKPAAPVAIPTHADSASAEQMALRRAAFEHARGDYAAVVATLAPLALEAGPRTAEPDRAAFLLAHALLRLGQHERFAKLAASVSAWGSASPFTRWIVSEARSFGSAGPSTAGATAADALAASRLLAAGDAASVLGMIPARGTRDAVLIHLRAEALALLGKDASSEWEALLQADSTAGLARDLAGHAAIRLATRAAGRGGDPRPWLARVPAGSRYASRARHMAALATLERGDTASARASLEQLLASDSTYNGRREVLRTLGRLALDAGDWDRAYARHAEAAQDWQRARAALREKSDPAATSALWDEWRFDGSLSGTLVLDGFTAAALAERLAHEAGDLTRTPTAGAAGIALPAAPRVSSVPPPPAEGWERVRRAEREAAAARGALALCRDSLARERARLGDARRYYGSGLAGLRAGSAGLRRRTRLLDSLGSTMDETAARLIALRDEASVHLQRRAASVLARVESQERWIRALDHLYLQGPDADHQSATPPQQKGPDVVVAQERELAQNVRFAAQRMLQDLPRRMTASYERAWGPRLMDRAGALAPGARELLARERAVEHTLDSSLAAAGESRELRRLVTRTDVLEREAARSASRASAARADVAHEAVAAALAALGSEREAIDYGLAASAWARAVRLSAADSLPVAARASGARAPEDPYAAEQDSASMHGREEAISRVSVFLADHPGSPARGEMRFRLADLLVTQARAEFRGRMTAWLAAQARGEQAPLPVADHAQAVELYRRILAEDGSLPHRDAVLFNAGLLLSDAGDPEAATFFRRLLAEHPASAYAQESSLRLGDFAFDAGRMDEGVSHYARAARGGDPTLTAIALYKSGWAHYNAGRFSPAADAFRGVLDLYAGEAGARVQADLEHEAEQYFVNSLAASGGAAAFERAFPAGRERPYERRVLRLMGQHLRRYGEFPEAAAADRLYLRRWPADPAALDVVAGLAETQRRSERPAEERATRLTWASRFAPGGEWANAQSSDSLRRAGESFARAAWRDEALEHHRLARTAGSRDEWREALRHYELLLARWPQDSSRAVYELHAGEACAELADHPAALAHYRRAAALGRDSVAARAAWQVVAVTDRWYESTRPGASARGARRGTGRDTLARAVIAEAESLLTREPRHPKSAELVWRTSQLALAHGWEREAQASLARFARTYPTDARAPLAAHERAQSLFRGGAFAAAGEAFEEALVVARRGGADSLARRAEQALPVCAYRAAEASVRADSSAHAQHAEAFAEVAKRWPAFESAPLAQYRSGLAWLEAGRTADGVRALGALTERWPSHVLARESRVRAAQAWEGAGERERAATAWVEFAERHPGDAEADEAWLRAADLCDSAGLTPRADQLRASYLQRWPDDQDAALEILERLARHELRALPEGGPVSALLTLPRPVGGVKAKPAPYLAQYLKRVAKTPAAASKPLLAEVRFRTAEETFATYSSARLTQPLPPSIAAKQRLLDSLLVRYRRTADLGVPEWAHAATYRIGEALVGFGESLENSERPADLTGDDLKGYENVLLEQAMNFHSQGENVWSDLLRRTRGASPDAWTARTRTALWSRLGDRFLFLAEGDFPVAGDAGGDAPSRQPEAPR
jgi:tetratricopeptide (TPR) repeat protein